MKKRFDYIIDDNNKYPGAPSVNIKIINKNERFILGDKEVIPIEVYMVNYQYWVTGLIILLITDVKSISENEILKLKI